MFFCPHAPSTPFINNVSSMDSEESASLEDVNFEVEHCAIKHLINVYWPPKKRTT